MSKPFWDTEVFHSKAEWERWAEWVIAKVHREILGLRGLGLLFATLSPRWRWQWVDRRNPGVTP